MLVDGGGATSDARERQRPDDHAVELECQFELAHYRNVGETIFHLHLHERTRPMSKSSRQAARRHGPCLLALDVFDFGSRSCTAVCG